MCSDIVRRADSREPNVSKFFKYTGYCHTCRSDFIQAMKVCNASNGFSKVANKFFDLPPLQFEKVCFDANELMVVNGLQSLCNQNSIAPDQSKIKIRVSTIFTFSIESTEGAYFHGNMEELVCLHCDRVVRYDPECDFTIVIMKSCCGSTEDDFIVLGRTCADDETIVEFSKSMTPLFECSGKRQGAASGFAFSDSKSSSRSVVTKQPSSVTIATPFSVATQVVYNNKNSTKKKKNSKDRIIIRGVYRDIESMHRTNSSTKLQKMLKCAHYRQILLSEGVSRIKAILTLIRLGLLADDAIAGVRTQVKDMLIENKKNHFKWKGHTSIESAILTHIASTGEMINFCALPCHVDGNKSHPVETLAYHGRVSKFDTRSTKDIVGTMSKACLLCCNAGIILEAQCPRDIVHCSLKHVFHVADQSRNFTNFSRAYGPK